MKKLVLSVAAACMLFSSAIAGGNGEATTTRHDEPVAGGFFLDAHLGVYGPKYLVDKDFAADLDDDSKVSMIGYGLEIGSMFQISEVGDGMGIGIRAIWFGFGMASGSNDVLEKKAFNMSFLSPGIYFTKALGDNALDLFVNYVPTLAVTTYAVKGGEFTDADLGGGSPLKLGATFRTGVLMAGLEYNLGNVGYTVTSGTETVDVTGSANHLRVLIGCKF